MPLPDMRTWAIRTRTYCIFELKDFDDLHEQISSLLMGKSRTAPHLHKEFADDNTAYACPHVDLKFMIEGYSRTVEPAVRTDREYNNFWGKYVTYVPLYLSNWAVPQNSTSETPDEISINGDYCSGTGLKLDVLPSLAKQLERYIGEKVFIVPADVRCSVGELVCDLLHIHFYTIVDDAAVVSQCRGTLTSPARKFPEDDLNTVQEAERSFIEDRIAALRSPLPDDVPAIVHDSLSMVKTVKDAEISPALILEAKKLLSTDMDKLSDLVHDIFNVSYTGVSLDHGGNVRAEASWLLSQPDLPMFPNDQALIRKICLMLLNPNPMQASEYLSRAGHTNNKHKLPNTLKGLQINVKDR